MVGCCHDNCSSQHNKHSSNLEWYHTISYIIHIKWYKTSFRLLNHSSGISLATTHRWHRRLAPSPATPSHVSIVCRVSANEQLPTASREAFLDTKMGVFRGEFFDPKRKRQFRGSMDDWLMSMTPPCTFLKVPFAILDLVISDSHYFAYQIDINLQNI